MKQPVLLSIIILLVTNLVGQNFTIEDSKIFLPQNKKVGSPFLVHM
ncbi:MAG: hypothetical protein RIR12_884 [Bacteroidota bacterium]|jgi:hypothetical protein